MTTARVQLHKAPAETPLVACEREHRADLHKAPIRGSLCAFEHPRSPGDAEISRLAARQHQCIHRRQLLAADLGRSAIATRVRRRFLTPILRDVYLVGHTEPEPLSLAMATVLHLRGHGVIGWEYGAWLWGLADHPPDVVSAVVARYARSPHPGVTIHRVPALDRADIRWRKGLPVTAPARTLIDFAATADPLEAESALAKIRYEHLAGDKKIREALDRVPRNHPGAPTVRQLLELEPGELSLTKSVYERRLRRLIEEAGLPLPTSNHGVEGVQSDLVWPAQKLIVEFDGWEHHRHKVHADKARDARLIAAGWRIMRVTADRVDHHSYELIAQITRALLSGE